MGYSISQEFSLKEKPGNTHLPALRYYKIAPIL